MKLIHPDLTEQKSLTSRYIIIIIIVIRKPLRP